ncbi:MAG: leucine-rich repeat protein [Treponema sp.]|nr:leucine-rich repeat protein [Treponema sp.]
MKNIINITYTNVKGGGKLIKAFLATLFAVVLLLISSCDSLTNPDSGKNNNQNQNQNQGQDDIPVVEVTLSELKTKIQNYQAGSYTIYKVKGSMSNSEFSELQDLIEDKSDNLWGDEYVGLDLSEVTGLTRIDCTWGFKSLTIPSSVTEFGDYSQFDCVKILDGNPNFEYVDGVLYSADKTSLYFYPIDKKNKAFEIPSGVKRIQSAAFLWNNNIQSITIPESVEFIGMAALQSDSITQLTFKDKENWYNDENRLVSASDLENPASYREGKVRGICRDGLFKPVTKTVTAAQLTEEINSYDGENYITYKVTGSMSNNDYDQINQLIRNRGDQERWKGSRITLDLSGVTDLTTISYTSWPIASVTVPASFIGVGVDTAYTNIIVAADNPYYKYVDGSLYSADGTILYLYSSEKQEESFEIPSTVKKIWRFAFYNNTSIKNITIPESVVEIGWAAFDNDRSNLQTLTFKNKENWMMKNNNETVMMVDPDDLEKVENFRKDSETKINGIFRPGLYKTETKTVTFAQMMTELNSYEAGTYTIYKVTGEMTNNDYSDVFYLIWDNVNYRKWSNKYVGLDLSEVTGLTRMEDTWCFSTVIIPDTVTEIGNYTSGNVVGFESNPNFKYEDDILYTKDGTILCYYPKEKTDKSFEIPSTVTKIWRSAFAYNNYIENIIIPESLVYIGDYAFDNSNIQTLTFKNKENWMTRNNNNSVNPEDLENVQNYRWNQATRTNGICRNGLFKPETKTVTVAELINEINSFDGETYTVYKVTGSMSNDKYAEINQLIDQKSNGGNWSSNTIALDLSEVDGLTRISYINWAVSSVTIPNTVSEFGETTVYKVIVSDNNPYFKYVDEILYSADGTILYSYPDSKTSTSFVIPSTVKKVWSYAFNKNFNITSITISESVIYIGGCAFDNSNIQTLTFKNKENWMTRNNNNSVSMINPEDLEKVENYRWNQDTQTNGKCRNGLFKPEIKTVTVAQLPDEIDSFDGVTYTIYKVSGSMSNDEYVEINRLINNTGNSKDWNNSCFGLDLSDVKDLTKLSYVSWPILNITIPNDVSEFSDDMCFTKIIIPSTNQNFTYEDGILYTADKTVLCLYPSDKTDTSFVIPASVTKICREAFWTNSYIQSITIPETVVYICSDAFANQRIRTLTFRDKENWIAKTRNNGYSKINEADLENVINYRWDNNNQTSGLCENGLFKPVIKPVTVAQLPDEINSYAGGTYITYKVTGSMSNDEYGQISELIRQRGNSGSWEWSYIGLDLSEVTGLTKINAISWPIFSLTLPDSVSEFGEYVEVTDVMINSNNFVYEDGSLYSKDKTILYSYSSVKTDSSFEISSGVKKVWSHAFYRNQSIRTVIIPESVIYIGQLALERNGINTITFKNKQNWMYKNNNNNNVSKVEPSELDVTQNFIGGKFRYGLIKPEIVTVAADELEATIGTYVPGTYIIYKVTGSMTNSECNEIIDSLATNNPGYIGLDLSEVSGLTSVGWAGMLLYIELPDSVQ